MAVGVWKGGRVGTFRGNPQGSTTNSAATVFGTKATAPLGNDGRL